MFKYIISYDGGQLRDSGDFEWGLFDSYGEAEEDANDAKEEYMNDWDIEGGDFYVPGCPNAFPTEEEAWEYIEENC